MVLFLVRNLACSLKFEIIPCKIRLPFSAMGHDAHELFCCQACD